MSQVKKVERSTSESTENTCPVCHDVIEVFAIGPCDHPVCYRCSTRMRVLCEQTDCPICRSTMPQVAFVYHKALFKDISLRNCIPNRKFKIFYEDDDIEERFLELLEFRCRICPNRKPERSFAQLQTHMRRDHQLFACDLCVSNVKIFPWERKFYNRKTLATHRRLGDEDDKSYKGHPLCEFCDTRYNDKDDLLKHLRKDHYFCHFCDQNGTNAYYDTYPDVVKHFKADHFLCDEGECSNPSTRFTHAFVSEIDLKAHKASAHNKTLSKAQSREARTLELDFQYAPRRQGNNRGGSGITSDDFQDTRSVQGGGRGRGGDRYNRRRDYNQEDSDLQRAIQASKETAPPEPAVEEPIPDPVHDFPTLNGATVPAHIAAANAYKRQAESHEEAFPSLKSQSSETRSSKQQQPASTKAYSSIMNRPQDPKPVVTVKKESKPVSLGSVAKVSKERWRSTAPEKTEDEYPTLGNSGASFSNVPPNSNLGNWITKTHTKSTPVGGSLAGSVVKSNNNHKLKTPMTNSISDENEFPTLGVGGGAKRPSNGLSHPFTSDWKQKTTSKKSTHNPKSEKCDDDSFVLPDSYYKSYDKDSTDSGQNLPSESKIETSKSIAKPQPAPANSTKDFPSLPGRQVKTETTNDKKKKKKNRKEDKPASASQPENRGKMADDSNASLSDIASMLMQSGKDSKKSDSKQNPKPKPPKPTDWFDNPPTEQLDNKKPTPKPAVEKIQKKKEIPDVKNTEDFPSFHSMSISVQQPKPPPGFTPDFNPKGAVSSGSFAAPPGFNPQPSLVPVTPPPPPGFTPYAVYIQPPDFKTRNLKLIQDIKEALSTVEDGFSNFRALSGQFRQGSMNASDYYMSCQTLMGDENFNQVFPELLALLPDISKQQELWDIHQACAKNKSKTQPDVLCISKPSSKSNAPWKGVESLSQCPVCGQVMLVPDIRVHQMNHSGLSDFPSLGDDTNTSASGSKGADGRVQMNGSWIKAK